MASYENKWVALSRTNHSVVASADTLVALDRAVRDHDAVIYTRVLPENADFAPTHLK